MLVDPLPVKTLDTNTASSITVLHTDSFATIDVSPGRTVRQCADFGGLGDTNRTVLTISHTESNENKPAVTDRTLIRLDFDIFDFEGGPMTASAYCVIAAPRGAYVDASSSPTELSRIKLLQSLLGVLAVSTSAATLSAANATRILAGEP
jgi:hypothetical protein